MKNRPFDNTKTTAAAIQLEPLSRSTESDCPLRQTILFPAWLKIFVQRMAQGGTFQLLLCLAARQDMSVRSPGFAEEMCFRWEDDLLFLLQDSSSRLSV